MKKVGIIGGLGPQTSAEFCLGVGFACSKITKVRPNILISHVAIPLKTERDIINGKHKERILPLLVSSAKQLEKAGADFIVIPCNTVHVFIEDIRNAVHVPVLSIIEESNNFLISKNIKRVGLLGTLTTIHERLFDKILEKNKITVVLPETSDQLRLSHLIDRLVKNSHGKNDKDMLLKIIHNLIKKNVDCVLLACTDLQLLIKRHHKVQIFDTLGILEKATIRRIVGRPTSIF